MRLPRDLSGSDLAQSLRKLGYSVTRQTGSHPRLTTYEHGEHHLTIPLARIIHEGSWRKRADAKRDGHSEAGDWLCRLRQCLSRSSDGGRHQEGRRVPVPNSMLKG